MDNKSKWDQLLKFRDRLDISDPSPHPPGKVLKLYPARIHVYWSHVRTYTINYFLTRQIKGIIETKVYQQPAEASLSL